MGHRRFKLTMSTRSIFIKHKVDKPNGTRKVYYTVQSMSPKDMEKLSPMNQDLIISSGEWPMRRFEFKEIKRNLNTIIKYKTEI